MTNNKYDKVKLIILRAVLVVIGAGMGFLALWQYFLYYPDIVKREYQIVITVVSTALIALIFGLSAKAVYRLIQSVVIAVRGLGDRLGKRGIIAVVLGFVVAVGLIVGFDVLIRLVVDIWAVRLLADIIAYILCAAAACVCFTKLLNIPRSDKSQKADAAPIGYLIAAECFTDERVLTAVHTLINVKVCDGAYKALCLCSGDNGADGARLLDALVKQGLITVVNTDKSFTDGEAYTEIEKRLAAAKRLKRVSLAAADKELALGVFAMPSEDIRQAVLGSTEAQPQAEADDKKTLTVEPDDVINGQIIIDK